MPTDLKGFGRSAWVGAAVCLLVYACGGGESTSGSKGAVASASAPAVDVTADRGAAKQSWLVGVARDPADLVRLAQSNPGWAKIFGSDPVGALGDLRKPALAAGASVDVELGAARAALEVAQALQHVARLTSATWIRLGEVGGTAGGPELTAWRACFEARALQSEGGSIDAARKRLDPKAACAPLMAAMSAGDASPVSLWLKGSAPAGFVPPAGATPEWSKRLEVAALVAGGQYLEAERAYSAIDHRAADVVLGAGDATSLLADPALASLGARVMAGVTVEIAKDGGEWAALTAATALLMLDQPAAARARLAPLLALGAQPTATAPLAALILTGALDARDVLLEAKALDAVAQHRTGDAAGAKAAVEALPTDTIPHRVLKAWAVTQTGGQLDAAVFPEDRSVLARTVGDEVTALGAQATGAADVASLNLVERFVDAVERRFADAAEAAGEPERALKHLEAAEDKAQSLAPSPRNAVSALMHAARVNVRLGRPRVALKYLSRAQERLPAVTAPAELLRDVLTIRAMDQEGAAASGQ